MATTTFINNQTVIVADWLNDVNTAVYDGESFSGILNGTTLALQTGGIDAINIDANQQVSVANLNITGTFTFSSGVFIAGDLEFSDGTIQSSAAYCVANNCMYENNQEILDDYTVTAGRSASSVGPVTVAVGKSVTLPSGSRWVIL
jgi:hypothetical protein